MPQILVGLRQSLGVAWLALVVAEQINANAGLGFMISQATQFLRNDVIIVALLVYCVLGLLTDWLVRLLERRALAWRRSFVRSVTALPDRSAAAAPGSRSLVPASRSARACPGPSDPTSCWTTSISTSRPASSWR